MTSPHSTPAWARTVPPSASTTTAFIRRVVMSTPSPSRAVTMPCPVDCTATGSLRSAAKRTAARTSSGRVAPTTTAGRCRKPVWKPVRSSAYPRLPGSRTGPRTSAASVSTSGAHPFVLLPWTAGRRPVCAGRSTGPLPQDELLLHPVEATADQRQVPRFRGGADAGGRWSCRRRPPGSGGRWRRSRVNVTCHLGLVIWSAPPNGRSCRSPPGGSSASMY